MPHGMTLCGGCSAPFTQRFPGERYCSNRCAAEAGTATLPAAAPFEKPRPARRPPPPPKPPKGPMDYGTPVAVTRSRRWMAEHERTKFP